MLSIALETFNLLCVLMMSQCVQHKDVLLIRFHCNDFLVQLSFPFPFSLLYLVLSHSEVFLLSSHYSIYVLRAPKWWLFGLGHPWVKHWTNQTKERTPPALRSVTHNPMLSQLLYSVGHWKFSNTCTSRHRRVRPWQPSTHNGGTSYITGSSSRFHQGTDAVSCSMR